MMTEKTKQKMENEDKMESKECLKLQRVYSKPTITEIGKVTRKTLVNPGVDFDSGQVGNYGTLS